MVENSFYRIFHWGPLITLGIIFSISFCTVTCLGQWHNSRAAFMSIAANVHGTHPIIGDEHLQGSDAFWYGEIAPYVIFTFFLLSASTLYYYLNAMWIGPGHVPSKWGPERDEEKACLQYCSICESHKPPRAHHCRQCGKCVLKMDHHCPWINNCVGYRNHAYFGMFLISAVVGCSVAAIVLAPSVYWAMYRRWYIYYGAGEAPLIFLSLWGLLFNMFVLGLAVGVVIAVGILFYFQMRGIIRNRTGVEDWILEKANHRRSEAGSKLPPFIFPYNLGYWKNIREVFDNVWCAAKGDGIEWPVRDDCNQYTLTVEQIQQKACKRARSVKYVIRREFSGSWMPLTHGIGVFFHPPCTDEPRIQLHEGDIVIVTRWKKYWLYGDCVLHPGDMCIRDASGHIWKPCKDPPAKDKRAVRHRGWFPRHCAVPLIEEERNDPIGNGVVEQRQDSSEASHNGSTESNDAMQIRRRKLK